MKDLKGNYAYAYVVEHIVESNNNKISSSEIEKFISKVCSDEWLIPFGQTKGLNDFDYDSNQNIIKNDTGKLNILTSKPLI